uniref:Uncharacterized protein n=1 Tax=Rhizophora mucronata TaxID=61149 RepID=A0A2P2NUP9_RHIMU
MYIALPTSPAALSCSSLPSMQHDLSPNHMPTASSLLACSFTCFMFLSPLLHWHCFLDVTPSKV